MPKHTFPASRKASELMRETLGSIVEKLEENLSAAGLHALDEDEVSQLYLAALEGREPRKAANDITRARRWDSSTRTAHCAVLSLSQLAEDNPDADISAEHVAAGHYLAAQDNEYTPRDTQLGQSARFALVRALAMLSEVVSVDELLAAANTLNANGAWKQRQDAMGRPVGREYTTTAWRVRELRAELDLSLEQLPGIIQAADAFGLREAALRALSCAQAISEHYLGWFGDEIADSVAAVNALLADAEDELQALHERAAEVGEREGAEQTAQEAAAEAVTGPAHALDEPEDVLDVLEPVQAARWARVRQLRQSVRAMRCKPLNRGLWRRAARHRAAHGEKPGGTSGTTTPGRAAASAALLHVHIPNPARRANTP